MLIAQDSKQHKAVVLPVLPVRRDEGGERDDAALSKQLGYLANAADVLLAVLGCSTCGVGTRELVRRRGQG